MEVARTYGGVVASQLDDHPNRAAALINFGLKAESFRTGHLPDKPMPAAYRYLNHMAIKSVADALKHPETLAWTNIFAPVELLQCFDLECVSVEALSSYFSGFWIEDSLLDRSDAAGFAPTLCSYHRTFLGGFESGIIPEAKAAITTSLACDGNVNTFRHIATQSHIPLFVIDVPYQKTEEATRYVVRQLREAIALLEQATGKKFDIDRLREAIRRENRSKQHYLSFLEKRRKHLYPATLTLTEFTLFATHLSIGSEWAEKFFEMLDSDVEKYPVDTSHRIFWVHVTPYAEPALASYFNYSDVYSIAADDFNLDFTGQLDENHPLEALAEKLIDNVYNGPLSRKVDIVAREIEHYDCEGAIEFCHWGCRQSAGGAQLLRSKLRDRGIPMLVLDGDAVDRRNNQDGQIRTRLEAFFELLDGRKGGTA